MIHKTLIIAEAGVNHNGDIRLAKELIRKAGEINADIIKFQTFTPKALATRTAGMAKYQAEREDAESSQLEMLTKLQLPIDAYPELQQDCIKFGVEFLSSPFDLSSIDFLAKINTTLWKIPSGEITNYPYLRKIAILPGEIILSTGMSNLNEIESALTVLRTEDANRKITLLHCNTEYPTPYLDVNLKAMEALRTEFGLPVGYSDHTEGIEVAIAAVALGATVIEKHFTLDRNLPGPDHKASLEPKMFGAMVRAIRNIEKSLGSGIKQPSPSEMKNIDIVRKSIVAAKPIRAGEQFTIDNLTTKRPGTGISPMNWERIIGRISSRNYKEDEAIEPVELV